MTFFKNLFTRFFRRLGAPPQGLMPSNHTASSSINPMMTSTAHSSTQASSSSATGSRSKKIKFDPRAPLPENTVIESYQLHKVIGRGSFSLVYSGTDSRTNLPIVAKEYYPKRYALRVDDSLSITPTEDKLNKVYEEGFKQFFKEAIALTKIKHPNIIKNTDMFRANHTAYMISPSTGGHDLKWFITNIRKAIDLDQAYQIFMPVLSALHYMHSANLLHLDIKPANILLQPNRESLLLDLGAVQGISSTSRFNSFQTLTHGFAPHEQYDKDKALGPWTDIYALAATLYCCITLKPPAKSVDGKIAGQLDTDTYGEDYPHPMLEAVNNALSYAQDQRFTDVDTFARKLLDGSKWATLRDYELRVMHYDRTDLKMITSQNALAGAFLDKQTAS